MPFGKHRGKLLSEIPGGYLQWALTSAELVRDDWRLWTAIRDELVARDARAWAHSQRAATPPPTSGATPAIPLVTLQGRVRDWYHELAMRYHPDLRGGDTEAMKVVNEARDRLVKVLGL